MLRRKGIYAARIHVPEDVREHVGRAELWRSTLTADAREGKVRAQLWEAHFGSLFPELRRSSHRIRREQIDSLVQGYLAAQLEQQVEERLAVGLDAYNAERGPTGFAAKSSLQRSRSSKATYPRHCRLPAR